MVRVFDDSSLVGIGHSICSLNIIKLVILVNFVCDAGAAPRGMGVFTVQCFVGIVGRLVELKCIIFIIWSIGFFCRIGGLSVRGVSGDIELSFYEREGKIDIV